LTPNESGKVLSRQESVERLVEKLNPSDMQVMTNRSLFSKLSFNAHEHHCLFINGKGQRFIEAGYPLGLDVDQEGRGVAVADLDQDGRVDLLVRAVARRKLTYFHNDASTTNHFFRVNLEGTRSNRDGVGAVVRLSTGGLRQMRIRSAGSGFQGQSEGTLHFGIGTAGRVDLLRVEWPSGLVEQFTNLPADHLVEIVEGQGKAAVRRPAGWHPATAAPATPDVTPVWSARKPDGMPWHLPRGKPVLLTFWASWCVPCRAEVPVLNEISRTLGGILGMAGVAIAETEPGAAGRFIADTGPVYQVLFSSREEMSALLEKLFPEGDIPLPAAVLFDANGHPKRVFRGGVTERAIEHETRELLR